SGEDGGRIVRVHRDEAHPDGTGFIGVGGGRNVVWLGVSGFPPINTHVVKGGVQVARVGGIVDHPSSVAAEDFVEAIAAPIGGDDRAVVLCPASKVLPVAGGDVHVVKHGAGQAIAAIFPGLSSVG